jgi:hypothetical protein
VGHVAHGVGTGGHRQAEHALALGHVEQLVLDAVGTFAGVLHAANHQVVLLERAPGRVLDLAATGRALDDLRFGQGAELARALQVGAYHRGHIGLRGAAATLVRHGHDGDRQCGGIAAHDVDFQALLGQRRERQQQGSDGTEPARHFLHGSLSVPGRELQGIAVHR